MELDLTPEQRKFQNELREYFAEMMTEELTSELSSGVNEGGGPEFREAMKRMGRDGLLGVSWPRQYGGSDPRSSSSSSPTRCRPSASRCRS